jgi:Origin recognition complex subunit 6 (ORC6)
VERFKRVLLECAWCNYSDVLFRYSGAYFWGSIWARFGGLIFPRRIADPDSASTTRMATSDIEQSLQHLLPTVPSPRSPLLISTASAIRNLSRSKVPLRRDEEPARAWLASFVAAERSKCPHFTTNTTRLATRLNLPAPKLNKNAPITIPQRKFKGLLGTFRSSIPDTLITADKPKSKTPKKADIQREVAQLCAKILESNVSQSYLLQTVEAVLAAHPQLGSRCVILAATFLIVVSWKDGVQRKISGHRKVVDAFDAEFTNRQLGDWIGIIDEELEKSGWFEKNPVMMEEKRGVKRGLIDAEEGGGKKRTVKNISGVGIMVCSCCWHL